MTSIRSSLTPTLTTNSLSKIKGPFKTFSYKKKPWDKLVNSSNEELVDDKAFDLLTKMLTIDHIDRCTASEALAHSYFESIR